MGSCPSGSHGRQAFSIYVLETGPNQLYVGVTANSVTERIHQHRTGTGARSSRRKHVVRRRRDLEPCTVCATRERAEEIERRTAAKLRARGYDVEQG